MTETQYLTLIKMFMILMPLELGIVGMFAWACIKNQDTNHPAFWYALLCIGVLLPEIVRGVCILYQKMPPHPKHVELWIIELIPFGGFIYEICKRYLYKVHQIWINLHND
jgi:hypothetical protein